MRFKKPYLLAMCLILFNLSGLANVTFSDKGSQHKTKRSLSTDNQSRLNKKTTAGSFHKKNKPYDSDKPQQYELFGYVNGKYGHFFVEKVNDQQIVGYWFDSKGNKKNINGEWVNNTLQIYEASGKRSIILLNNNDEPPDRNHPPNTDHHILEKQKNIPHHLLLKD